ncbi:MAG: Asp-tRNA(Asn)/Glu-tRNA(Gln) amidotransferase subunit GatC [Flavobacteriia bacterium]|jgi:aspartyl-tRNA(Asn)/glutamyl-tRNA(Gln) amidotransferase subunit C|nr:Asp-tRNA(Asn)/Glu-tRNA(Gln) amidotransferase subunit GatC [Flavobacteriia bacterium]NBY40028.1 Asp-tRNA(Asn)/Glu-tRNA(Gln) amidotransferase subunit GatC [Flavobacteriia bacterium]
MIVTEALIDHLSHLAKLEFKGDQRDALKKDLEKIIGFMDQLNGLDTSEVEPLIFMSEEINRYRKDEIERSITHDEALRNAPKKDSDFFRIPKVRGKHS